MTTEMADEKTHPDMDYAAHQATWDGFMRLSKWGIGIIVVLLVLLYFVVQPHIA